MALNWNALYFSVLFFVYKEGKIYALYIHTHIKIKVTNWNNYTIVMEKLCAFCKHGRPPTKNVCETFFRIVPFICIDWIVLYWVTATCMTLNREEKVDFFFFFLIKTANAECRHNFALNLKLIKIDRCFIL